VITLDDYAPIVGEEVVGQLHRLAEHLQGRRFVHINSTAVGGGVAEILNQSMAILNQLVQECHKFSKKIIFTGNFVLLYFC